MRVDIEGYLEKSYDSGTDEFNDDYVERVTDYFDDVRTARKEFEELHEELTDDIIVRFVEKFEDKRPTRYKLNGGKYRENRQ